MTNIGWNSEPNPARMAGERIADSHRCGRYHYGNHSMVRQCCVDFALRLKANIEKYAFTSSHPASIAYNEFAATLTDAEWEMVR